MIKIKKLTYIIIFLIVPSVIFAQKKADANGDVGQFSFGMRNTFSMFSSNNRNYIGMSVGGNFRIQLGERINLESFGDFITTDVDGLAKRTDFHGGFSVMPYFFKKPDGKRFSRIEPYPIAGFCIDYSKFAKKGDPLNLPNNPNEMERYSFAAQFGAGTHINITKKLDLTIVSSYMFHIGNDIDLDIINNQIYFAEQTRGSLEGHLLLTVSLNLMIADLW